MAKPILDEALWAVLELLLPPDPPRPRGGRLDDRQVLTGILFVLRSGIPWGLLPKALGCGSGMTCWRRLQERHAKGLRQRLRHELLKGLLLGCLETNRDSLPHYGQRYRAALPILTGFTESTVSEVVAKRRNKNQQMRWNRYTVQPFLTVRVHVLRRHLGRSLPGPAPGLPDTAVPGVPLPERTTTFYAPMASSLGC
jgi:transposase